jgi:hypothetical protein
MALAQTPRAPCKRLIAREITTSMEIRFISSLTAEDEELFAPAVLKAVSALLDQLPIAYTLRIETSGSQVFQHTHAGQPAHVRDADPARRDDGRVTRTLA